MRSFYYGRAARFLYRQHPEAGVQLIWVAKKASRYCLDADLGHPAALQPYADRLFPCQNTARISSLPGLQRFSMLHVKPRSSQ